MTRDEARQEIRRSWREIILTITEPARDKVNGETTYICPLCGHGSHGDGLKRNPKSKDGYGLKCFGCDFAGDIIDLYQRVNKTDYNTTLSLLADILRIDIDPYKPAESAEKPSRAPVDGEKGRKGVNMPLEEKPATDGAGGRGADYRGYYARCLARLNDPAAVAYLAARGISIETAMSKVIGFDPMADPASAPGGEGEKRHPAPRMIIPTTAGNYVGRAIDPETPKQYAKINAKGSSPGIFNRKALYSDAREVFVVEGAFDALSILEAGAAAVAINSTSNAEKLIERLREEPTEATLILCLDNDNAGRRAAETLENGLRELGADFTTADICGRYGDPNEHLTGDRAGFFSAVEAARRQARQETAKKPDNVGFYIDAVMSDEIRAFKGEIKTGFENLDKASGGLYPGFYILAATSSLGKTTFAHQVGDQIAAGGTDVLYFSLEMSRLEMVSKSIARTSARDDLKAAVSSLNIRKGYLPKNVLDASGEYRQAVGDRMSVIECNFSCSISFIGDYIRRYIKRNNVKPVCMIDYLQIMQPEEKNGGRRQTTKETVDSTVTDLKRLSRDLGITILAISSINRANYLTPLSFESLKESGNIEYTADVVFGMQLHCISEPGFDGGNITAQRETVKRERAATPRRIDLVCLKNRFGIANYNCSFEYYPQYDLFRPVDGFPEPERI